MKENYIIDTHSHINSEKFDQDRGKIITNAKENGVGGIINMGDTMESSEHVLQLAQEYDICYAGVGVHPEEAFDMKKDDFDKLAISDENSFAARLVSYALIDPKYVDYNLEQGLLPELVTNPRAFFNRYCKSETPFFLYTSGAI